MALYNGDKQIHELYNGDTYIEELYNGDTKIFDAGWNKTVSGTAPLTLPNARAKETIWKIEGQSKQGILPDGYTQLEYLENSAIGPYFQTTIQPITEKTVVEVKGYVSNGNSVFGGNGSAAPCFNSTSNTATTIGFRYGSTSITKTITDTNGKFYDTPAIIKFGNNKMYLDGELKKTLSEEPFTYDYPMRIWARTAGSVDSAIGRLYFANIYNEDTLVFSGVPCKRNSDNVLGLYDTVSNSFLAPSGTGTFTAGHETPTPTAPVDVKGVGNSILLTISDGTATTTYNINLSAPLQKIGTYKDSVESDGTLTAKVGKTTLSAGTHTISDAMTNSPYLCTQQSSGTLSGQSITLDTGVTNADVYYVKATATETTVSVPSISTIKGTNYIDVTTEIQPSDVSVTYRSKYQ